MDIHFATTEVQAAARFLSDDSFAYLNEAQKRYVLEHLGDIRVQDPAMHPSPSLLVISNQETHAREIGKLA